MDLTLNVVTVTETTTTIGTIGVELTREVEFKATQGDVVTISNTALTTVEVQIPDTTKVSAPTAWDNTIQPPKQITTSGTVAAGFQTPTTSISVGSPDVILVFDKAVTIILEGTTGQTAYKLSGTNNWVLIDTCTGTFASPNDPPVNGECSINDGTDTKILTFHFTEFAGISEDPVSISTTTTSTSTPSTSSGGGSKTGVGPRGSSSGFAGKISKDIVDDIPVIPTWFKTNVVSWWYLGLMTDTEIKSSIAYMLEQQIIDIPLDDKPLKPLMDLAPSVKHIFNMWSSGSLDDAAIIDIIRYYRIGGIW